MKIKIAPSILSADFSCLDREIKRVEDAGCDLIHIDVMDGHFVPNLTLGPALVKSIRKVTKLPFDVHLMIENPQQLIGQFVDAGSNMITTHIETISCEEFRKQAAFLKSQNVRAGISLNPAEPLERIAPVLDIADFVLVMSVNPGFSGQQFIPGVVPKIKALRAIFTKDIAVDGGVNDTVAGMLIKAGATILASGSYIFGAKNPQQAMERIRHAE
ncbi:MAG TPA: ribulose-phosphate 3-epimerase [Candidatus Omnitrophota bacterium]|nr:ribulose-phosphate 3-epimerase [Candidatus Omnitrophota bacterium]HPT07965.1 ribulose-phosphate 3-epimerase [Candidatus Omnitrophota bacterium]